MSEFSDLSRESQDALINWMSQELEKRHPFFGYQQLIQSIKQVLEENDSLKLMINDHKAKINTLFATISNSETESHTQKVEYSRGLVSSILGLTKKIQELETVVDEQNSTIRKQKRIMDDNEVTIKDAQDQCRRTVEGLLEVKKVLDNIDRLNTLSEEKAHAALLDVKAILQEREVTIEILNEELRYKKDTVELLNEKLIQRGVTIATLEQEVCREKAKTVHQKGKRKELKEYYRNCSPEEGMDT